MVSIEEHHIDIPEEQEVIDEEEIRFQVNEIKEAIMQLPDEYRIVMSLFSPRRIPS